MVLVNVKINDRNQFLYESKTSIKIEQLKKELVLGIISYNLVNNLRIHIDRIAMTLEELLKHGPLKPEGLRGLNLTEDLDAHIEDKYKVPKPKMPDRVGTKFNEDPSHQRIGWILDEELTNTILQPVKDAKDLISSQRAEQKKTISINQLTDIIDILKAGVMIGYPAYHGLPDWEPVKILLEEKIDLVEKE